MAVQDTSTAAPPGAPSSNGNGSGTRTGTRETKKSKRNKMLAIVAVAGGGVLLLAHKGKKTGEEGLSQQQIEEGNGISRQVLPVATPAVRPESGEGVEDMGGISGGGATPRESGVNQTAPSGALTSTTGATLTPAEIEQAVEKGLESSQGGGNTKAKASRAAPKKKAVKKHPTKATHKTGVHVHGRHFPGATGHHTSKVTHKHGKTEHHITVNHGGHTTTHISHDKGKSWTDHPAGRAAPHKTTHAKSHPAHKPAPHRRRVRA